MLKSLSVWNFALLEHIEVEFGTGLNILTGETGAGKSILIDAFGLVLGGKASGDAIRTGAEWLRVEAVFSLEDAGEDLKNLLEEFAVNTDDGELIITRQITKGGRSSVLLNGSHTTLTQLKKIGAMLVDIHGQHENMALLKTGNQFDILDNSQDKILDALDHYRNIYETWKGKKDALEYKEKSARDLAQRLDMLRWQNQEIEEAELKEGEDETLENEIKKLSHAEKISSFVEDAYKVMEGGGKNGPGVMVALSTIKKDLEGVLRYDDSLANSLQIVEEALVTVQEAAYEIRDYSESMEFNPKKLDDMQRRMDRIDRLRKKYGATVSDILKHQKNVQEEILSIENYDDDVETMKQEIRAEEEKLEAAAKKLTSERIKGAKELSAAIKSELLGLGMPKAILDIEVLPLQNYSPLGKDDLKMEFSANPGEAKKPLEKIASGGEISRIALALKTVSASRGGAPTMVFDEIDTGIGGRTAQMVAERIAYIANFRQVLCITHLPQIASMGDTHLYIAKKEYGGQTKTEVKELTEAMRQSEIARMASGIDATKASLDNAREMLQNARLKKNLLRKKGARPYASGE